MFLWRSVPANFAHCYQQYMQFIYLVHYLWRCKLNSTKELAYTPRHIFWDISALPAPFNVGLQDGIDT